MSTCPKCGRKLHLYNLSAYCPDCGTNLIMYGFEEDFYREAKMAELSQSVWSVRVSNLKASLIGSKWTVLRLVAAVLTLAAFLAPAANVALKLPFFEKSLPVSGLGLYTGFSDGTLSYLLTMTGNSLDSAGFSAFRALLFAYGFCVAAAVAVLLTSVLCFVSRKNMQKVTACAAAVGAVGCLVAFIVALVFAGACKKDLFLDGSVSFGLFVNLAAFLFEGYVCLHLWRHGIPVVYKEGMVERAAIYRKVKKGEVDVNDLPQPVVETAETRKIAEEIAKAEQGMLEAAYASGVKANELSFGAAAEDAPAEEAPAEEAPAEETPAEETPAEVSPATETPAEEPPAEETPAEETPAEKSGEEGQDGER